MLQTIKSTPKWLMAAALRPNNLVAVLRYRLHQWTAPPIKARPEHLLHGLASQATVHDDTFRHLSFTFSVIALSARVACAGNALTREKYIAFREAFPLKGSVCGKIRSLFALACKNETPAEHYVLQIKYMYPDKTELYASVVDRLFRIAAANGSISREAENLLSAIAAALGLAPADYAVIRTRYDRPSQAYQVLGVQKHTKPKALKKRYYELMQSYHPDRYSGDTLSPEVEMLLKLKSSEINTAYRTLTKRSV